MTPHHDYPGGALARGYQIAFAVWLVGFLLILFTALAGYITMRAHARFFAS